MSDVTRERRLSSSSHAAELLVTAASSPDHKDRKHSVEHFGKWALLGVILLTACALYSLLFLHPKGRPPTPVQVFWYGWISAASTGLGALPVACITSMPRWWLGVSNAVAAGMMMAASFSLLREGASLPPDALHRSALVQGPGTALLLGSVARTLWGTLTGLVFIAASKVFLDKHEHLRMGTLSGLDARKALLLVTVMTLHSFSEGVGIGVSFGGEAGKHLGLVITTTLTIHNVPEGMAVALVLMPKGVSATAASLWCVLTSVPQPIMAVAAFVFVEYATALLPVGLGFAAGAMIWVALTELVPEARADLGVVQLLISLALSMVLMWSLQAMLS